MRFRDPGILPVELWDVLVPGGILSDERAHVARALEELRAGTARTRSGRIVTECAGFDRVWTAGGAADPPRPFAGVEGGLPYAELVVDLGQTSVKCGLGDRRWQVARDGRGARELVAAALAGVRDVRIRILAGVCAEVFDDESFGPSTYDDLDRSIFPPDAMVMNDAELAALLALREVGPGKTLVLTLGFGVGGAIVVR